jgi:Na+-driven multidrug efflux pump
LKRISKNFTEGTIWRQLLLFALPFMASNALQVLYSTIDMMVVGIFFIANGVLAIVNAKK